MRVALCLVCSVLFLAGCPPSRVVWLVPGSTASALQFRLGRFRADTEPLETRGWSVSRCAVPRSSRIEVVWQVAADRPFPVGLVRYGVVPSGFREPVPAVVLEPGCYTISALGGGGAALDIDSDGVARER